MRKEEGISMIEVVVSIIILLMIALFAIYSAQSSAAHAKAVEVYAEMLSVQQAVETVRSQIALQDDFEPLQGVHFDAELSDDNAVIIYGSMQGTTSEVAKNLGINNLKRTYLVNFDSGDIRLMEPVDIQGTKIQTLSDAESLVNKGRN
ncbi:MAG: type II secretion system protein [Clostridia bacterium]|nr:type II secretion system protein [Clostridia bacterium]